MAELTGSEILAKCLKKEGIEDIFYIMGGPMLLAEATCITEGIRMIDVRHEQAAAFACQAYSRLKQTPSVCMAASGPGVTNLITGMAQCADRLLPGRGVRRLEPDQPVRPPGVPGDRPGRTDARLLQARRSRAQPEAHSAAGELRVADGDDRQAWSGLRRYAGRHPVPEDRRESGRLELRRTSDAWTAVRSAIRARSSALVKALAEAKQPLIVSGSGVIWSRAWTEMQAFVEAAGIPFYTTPQGRGVVPDDHPCSFLTMRNTAFADADLIIVLGTRMNYIIGHAAPPRFGGNAKIARIDIDPERDRHRGALRRHPDRRRLQDGAAAVAGRHQGQGDAGQLQGVAAEAGGRRGAEALGGRRQPVRRGRRHPSGAHARGGARTSPSATRSCASTGRRR